MKAAIEAMEAMEQCLGWLVHNRDDITIRTKSDIELVN